MYTNRFLPIVFLVQLINGLIAIVEIFLGLRFLLKLLGANPATPFVAWIYAMSEPLLEPFRGMFPSSVLDQGYIFEFSTLFAIVIYAIIGALLVEFVRFINRNTDGAVEARSTTTTTRTDNEVK